VSDQQRLLDALASPVRREILWLVADREMAAGEIAAAFEVTAPTISQHLAVLRRAGLVTQRSEGTFRYYRARRAALAGLESVLADEQRWQAVVDLPERAAATTVIEPVVRTWVDVRGTPEAVFRAFTDPAEYSRWLGVPVSLVDGRFACTMEWGTKVRGTYELVVAPRLLVMRWDFEDDAVPVPGDERLAYLSVTAAGPTTRVEVQQFVRSEQEAQYMREAWRTVLGRLHDGFGRRSRTQRAPRRKDA
jgi:DNA-binding transcriptional ArsR family regulator